jgi:anti-sigma B factor antagonist
MTRPPAFEVVVSEAGAVVTVTIRGELDLATAPRLDAELDRLPGEGIERVIVDLRELVFLDSTGLEAIVKFHKRTAAEGVDVAVVRGPRAVERLFAVMQLHRSLNLIDDPAELP